MADQKNTPRSRFASDDDDTGSQAPRRRSVLDDDDDLVGPRTVSAPRARRRGGSGSAAVAGTGRTETMISVLRDIPHFGRLVYRLARDPRVSKIDKALVVAALAYTAVPADAIPDVIPFLGELDDIVVVAVAVGRLVNNVGIELLMEHWDGDEAALHSALEVVERGSSLLPPPLKGLLLGAAR
ncbi:MAG TPA: DUF1232 domain-containing protein [Longimicrobium sp.]|jgi:uncharacterized membrane protein YkvA (DUF1232 family)